MNSSLVSVASSRLVTMMSVLYVCVALLVALAHGNTCGCLKHPQQLVCDADFVIKGKILSKSVTDEFHFLFGERQVVHYEVNVTTIFKGIDVVPTDNQIIHTTTERSQPCGYPSLDIGEKYLLTGSKYEDTELWSEGCQWNRKWSDLTSFQIQGLTNEAYLENCNCEVSSELGLRDSAEFGRRIFSGGQTCTFEYADAYGQSILKKRSCVRGCGRNRGCSWVRNDDYEDCFNANRIPDVHVRKNKF